MTKGKRYEDNADDKMSDFDLGMLNFMRARYPDKTKMGVELSGDVKSEKYNRLAAEEWYRYFKHHGEFKKAVFFASCMAQDRSYMLPALWPDEFDPSWRRRGTSFTDRSQPKDR